MEGDVGIVGYDCLSPLGTTFRSTWHGLVNNRSGIRFIDRYDPAKETLKGVSVVEFGGQIPVAYAEMAGSSERFNRCPEPAHHCIGPVCRRLFEEIDFNIAQHDPQRIAILGATALTSEISQHTLTETQRPYVNFILNQCHNIPLTVVARESGSAGAVIQYQWRVRLRQSRRLCRIPSRQDWSSRLRSRRGIRVPASPDLCCRLRMAARPLQTRQARRQSL